MRIDKKLFEAFLLFILERESVRKKKEAGESPPWTDCPVLQKFKFTNIFREFDRTTVWYRKNIREVFDNTPDVLKATIIFRWFNLIETGETLLNHGLIPNFNRQKAVEVLVNKPKIFTGAYITRSETGMSKLNSIAGCLELMLKDEKILVEQCLEHNSLEWMTNRLSEYKMAGPFMSYEIVTDLRHTYLLKKAKDIMTWANPGPGAVRGVCRLHGIPLNKIKSQFTKEGDFSKKWYIDKMKQILDKTNRVGWLLSGYMFEMRDIEHTLCEFDKYQRTKTGEGRTRSLYNYGEVKWK